MLAPLHDSLLNPFYIGYKEPMTEQILGINSQTSLKREEQINCGQLYLPRTVRLSCHIRVEMREEMEAGGVAGS